MMYQLYNRKLGTFHDRTEEEAAETIRFYHMWQNAEGMWQNGRGDMFMWEKEQKENEESLQV